MASRNIYEQTFDEDVQEDEQNGCPECDGRVTANAHQTICEDCGLILADEQIDHGPEWREFDEDETTQRRTGAPNTVARHDHGIGSAFEDRRTRKNSWIGAFLIVGWYWLGVTVLSVVDGLTIGLLPNMTKVGKSIATILPHAAGTPGMTLIMAMLSGTSMVALKALFFIREVLLYVYLYGMPIGIAVAYGNVPILSTIARRLCAQFIPLAVLPLPAAVLFRGYELLFTGDQQLAVEGSFLEYLVVISLPILGLYVTWRTFRYAAPLAARTLSRAGRGAVIIGAAAGAGYAAGPGAAAATARWGPKAGAGSVMASQLSSGDGSASQDGPEQQQADDSAYRRKENDPAYY